MLKGSLRDTANYESRCKRAHAARLCYVDSKLRKMFSNEAVKGSTADILDDRRNEDYGQHRAKPSWCG